MQCQRCPQHQVMAVPSESLWECPQVSTLLPTLPTLTPAGVSWGGPDSCQVCRTLLKSRRYLSRVKPSATRTPGEEASAWSTKCITLLCSG